MKLCTWKTFAILSITAGLLVALWLSNSGPMQEDLSLQLTEETGIGTREDPRARAHYEWMRLRSPKTGKIPAGIRQRELDFAKALPKQTAKTITWQRRGPINVGGRTRALAIDVTDESTILAGGVSGGIWRSTDGGTSWAKMTEPGQLHSVTWLKQDPRSGETDTWYAGTGEFRGNSASDEHASYLGNGIYKSIDGGQSWQLLESTTSDTPHSFDSLFDFVWKVTVNPSNTSQDEVYAATFGAIYRSVDGGNSWSAVLAGNSPFPDYTDVVVTSAGIAYAALSSDGGTKGIWTSSDGKPDNWTDITPEDWPGDYDRVLLTINPSNEDEVWALARAPGSGPNGGGGSGDPIDHVLWKYDASSDTWIDFSDRLPTRGGKSGDFNSQTNYNLILAAHPDDSNIIFVGGRNLWRIDVSTPASDATTWIGGYTFANNSFDWYNPSGSDRHHPDQHAIEILPSNGDVMYVGSDGGVHRTDDNQAGSSGSAGDGSVLWTSLNDAYYTTQFYSVCFNSDDSDPAIAGGIQDNGTWSTTSTSPNVGWTQESSGDGGPCTIINKSDEEGTFRYISSQNGKVRRFDYDSNGTLQGVTRIDPSGASTQLFINPFVFDPTSPTVMFYPAGSTMWRATDVETATQSTGWTEMTGISNNTTHSITALDVSKVNDAHTLYYGTSGGQVYQLSSADTKPPSAIPTDVTNNLPISDADANPPYISSIAIDPTNSDKVMVVFSNYEVESIHFTTDGGNSWTNVEGNLGGSDGPSVRWATILPQSGQGQNTYYVGTSTGVYSTTDLSGESTAWSQEGPNTIGSVVVDQVRARQSDGLVLAGTHANGVYSFDANTFSKIAANIFLEGPYTSNGQMSTDLNSSGHLPTDQPYSSAPWNYAGSESVSTIPNSDIVDWVLLELRETSDGVAAARRAAFLKYDGSVVDTDGVSAVSFPGVSEGDYFLVMHHRNHLPVMSASPITISSSSTASYGFTTGQEQAYGTNPMSDLGDGSFGLVVGDVNSDGQVKYSGPGNDLFPIFEAVGNQLSGTASGYLDADVGLNGQAKYSGPSNDLFPIFEAVGNQLSGTRTSQVP